MRLWGAKKGEEEDDEDTSVDHFLNWQSSRKRYR